MNKLTTAKRTQIVTALVEGMGIRATARLCDVTKAAVSKLLADIGAVCEAYQDEMLRSLPCKRLQCDEIWSFIGCKAKRVTPKILERNPYAGDAWTWTAICADTKIVPCWLIADRSAGVAWQFMQDVASRLTHRVQLTTDAHNRICLLSRMPLVRTSTTPRSRRSTARTRPTTRSDTALRNVSVARRGS